MISGRETETLPIQIFSNMPAAIAAASSKNAAKIFLFFRTALSAEFFPYCVIPSVVFPYYSNRYKYLVFSSSPVSIL